MTRLNSPGVLAKSVTDNKIGKTKIKNEGRKDSFLEDGGRRVIRDE